MKWSVYMGNFYLRQQDQRQWLCYLFDSLEGYNRKLFLQIQEQYVDGIISVTFREEAKGKAFLYDIGTKVSYSEFIKEGITEEKLLKLLISIVYQADSIKNNYIDPEVILWSPQCIFINRITNQIGFIVDFSIGERGSFNLLERLGGLLNETRIYASPFSIKLFILQYLKESPGASLAACASYLEELYNKFFGSRQYSGHLTLTSRLDEKGIHIDDFVQTANFQDKRTDALGEVCLIRTRTKERIPIVKENFIIGKEASTVDYCIRDNAAVSRSHACIVSMDSRYYIKDLGSTNRTYVNNLEVSGNKLQELRPGYRITIANEVFYFQ